MDSTDSPLLSGQCLDKVEPGTVWHVVETFGLTASLCPGGPAPGPAPSMVVSWSRAKASGLHPARPPPAIQASFPHLGAEGRPPRLLLSASLSLPQCQASVYLGWPNGGGAEKLGQFFLSNKA